jgi:NifU-like protein involved in Fe-S cluster formation
MRPSWRRRAAALADGFTDGRAAALADGFTDGFTDGSIGWQDLEVFAPVARHRSRHRCVTLAFEALACAMAQAGTGG